MRIGILNLPFDNNYGGNLQRYALITVLQRLGHQVEHINLHRRYKLPWYKKPYSYSKRILQRIFFGYNQPLFVEKLLERQAAERNVSALQFYERYIPHTKAVYSISDIKTVCKNSYDAYIVGSDQVWREGMTRQLGLENYYLKFTEGKKCKRLAYAVSLGNNLSYDKATIHKLTPLYAQFDAVSVREYGTIELIESYGWNQPKPLWTLDPTMLLDKSDYERLIDNAKVIPNLTSDKIFCYILDLNDEIMRMIAEKQKVLGCESIIVGLSDTQNVSIEQWLCNIMNSKMVITDSFHGTVFSVLFNKPFVFVGNEKRGNARIDSLFKLLDIKNTDSINWSFINKRLEEQRILSISFLQKSLQS